MDRAVRLRDLANLGPVTERQLGELGIDTPAQLADLGAIEAWHRLRAAFPTVNRICLYALEGALRDIDWRDLPPQVLSELKRV